jgi:hypothetical protein
MTRLRGAWQAALRAADLGSGVYLRFVVALWRGLPSGPLSGALGGPGPPTHGHIRPPCINATNPAKPIKLGAPAIFLGH